MNAIVTQETAPRVSLVQKFADRYGIEADKLLGTLKATAFRQREGKTVTNEQMAALLIVADQYRLNPFTKEIFAFEDKGAIIPVVSVDGWARIINEHPMLDGIEFAYSEEIEHNAGAKKCPAWCEVIITRKDRSKPVVVREYLDEVYIGPRGTPPKNGPWQTHTKRFLRHKTLIQGSRIAFGFAGIHDEDEAHRIIEGQAVRTERPEVADLADRLRQRGTGDVVDAEFTAHDPDPADAEPSPLGADAEAAVGVATSEEP